MTVQIKAPKTTVKLDGTADPDSHVLSAELFTGGRRLYSAVFEILAGAKSDFLDLDFARFSQQEVEISAKVGAASAKVVHWGKIAGYSIRHGSDGEYWRVQSRMEYHHFGDPLKAIPLQVFGGSIKNVQVPCIFNEEIDGQVLPNRAPGVRTMPIFLDYESARTALSQSFNGGTPEFWTLQDAAKFLCRYLNAAETYITNPLDKDFLVLSAHTKVLRNHYIKYGHYLPTALDELLEPYGYSWYVKLEPGKRTIAFFKRGDGTPHTLSMQEPGKTFDFAKTTTEQVDISFDAVSRGFNAVTILGDYEHYEYTFELMPAWDAKDDSIDDADMAMEANSWTQTPRYARVWRDWVLNEAGDYNRSGYWRAYNFDSLFGKSVWYPHRRKFLPTITQGLDLAPIGQTGGLQIEWWDKDEKAWKPVDELGSEGRPIQILQRECGIRFCGAVPPAELVSQGISSTRTASSRIKVTATVISDKRMAIRKVAGASLIGDVKELVLDVHSKFKKREVKIGGKNYTAVASRRLKSTQINDVAAMGALAAELLENWNQASIDGSVTLTGTAYNVTNLLGNPIQGVVGRRVKFSTNSAGTKFPSVIGVRVDFERQQTTLSLDTYQRERGHIE